MKLTEKLLPPGYSWRELWLPQNIIPNSSLLGSIHGGHPLALTGAQLGSTVNGLEMRGAELITITDHADIHINDSLTVVLPAFILPTIFSAAAGADMGIMNLNNGAVIARLNSTTGALDFIFNDVDGGVDEIVSTTKVSWAAGTLWQVAFTFKFAPAGTISVRLYINGVAENTNDQCDQVITVPAGNTRIGTDGVTFFTGKFQRMFLVYSTTVLTAAQLLEIYRGIPYPTNLKAYLPLDHPGRALTMLDRSTGGNCSGTISGTALANIWDFGACKQATLDLDGIVDCGISSAGINISGDLSVIWVGKMKSAYHALSNAKNFYHLRIGANHEIQSVYGTENLIKFNIINVAGNVYLDTPLYPAIDDYWIMIGTIDAGSTVNFLINGVLVDSDTQPNLYPGLAATAYIGRDNLGTANRYDVSSLLLLGFVNGALSIPEAKQVSRLINNSLGLGLSI